MGEEDEESQETATEKSGRFKLFGGR
jgi:hypothetical protein